MSVIHGSTKLATLIGIERLSDPKNGQQFENLYRWNAQTFFIHKKKCIIVTNKATLYSVVRLNILKKDLSNLVNFFSHSLITQLTADQLYDKSDFWIPFFSEINYCKTDNDKKVIGSINDLIFQLKVAVDYNSQGLGIPTDTNAATYLNNNIMGLLKYARPIESLKAVKTNA